MKLRNKKTGEIVEPFGIICVNGRTFVQFDDGKGTFKYEAHSLAELNEEWEDYEEPKQPYYITAWGDVSPYAKDIDKSFNVDGKVMIGNYFETKEEAEEAAEKLKAYKRLKDKGFKFEGWDNDQSRTLGDFVMYASIKCLDDIIDDLNFLFRGE